MTFSSLGHFNSAQRRLSFCSKVISSFWNRRIRFHPLHLGKHLKSHIVVSDNPATLRHGDNVEEPLPIFSELSESLDPFLWTMIRKGEDNHNSTTTSHWSTTRTTTRSGWALRRPGGSGDVIRHLITTSQPPIIKTTIRSINNNDCSQHLLSVSYVLQFHCFLWV